MIRDRILKSRYSPFLRFPAMLITNVSARHFLIFRENS
ncbi:hypothetical protein BN135_1679 [Cronobacter muytjensii 530]